MVFNIFSKKPTPPDKKEETVPVINEIEEREISFEHVKNLEDELRYTKENLQATVEERVLASQ